MDISDCLDRDFPIAQWLERWYVKPGTLGSIPGWGSQITFLNSSDSTSFELISSYHIIYCLVLPLNKVLHSSSVVQPSILCMVSW